VLNEAEHANVSCTFHYPVAEQKQTHGCGGGGDPLSYGYLFSSKSIMTAIFALINKKSDQ